jgi:putative transposase
MKREEPLSTGNVYHILNKSIAGYTIFTSDKDYSRMIQMLRFFAVDNKKLPRFARFLEIVDGQKTTFEELLLKETKDSDKNVQIIAYCFMPTHFHLILKQLKDGGISTFTGNLSNSYARYFNIKYKRKGRLWEDKFKNVSVDSDEQLLHLTRYIHLNPVTAGIVDNADKWRYSSYREYLKKNKAKHPICDFEDILSIDPLEYTEFVESQVEYQKELAIIKKITME